MKYVTFVKFHYRVLQLTAVLCHSDTFGGTIYFAGDVVLIGISLIMPNLFGQGIEVSSAAFTGIIIHYMSFQCFCIKKDLSIKTSI